jgi:hypothetical protein
MDIQHDHIDTDVSYILSPYPISTTHIPYRYPYRNLIDVGSPVSISNIDIGSYLITLLRGRDGGAHLPLRTDIPHGMAVQADPSNPTLKPLGTQRLNLRYDTLLSSFTFKLNLRRYITVALGAEVGQCRLNPTQSKLVLKACWFQLLKLKT